MIVIYGIPNCNTMKKARQWLLDNGIQYEFHDFKTAGLDASILKEWKSAVGWETLLNKRGMTWRKLPDTTKAQIDEASATKLMLEKPTLIKRPILEYNGQVHIGFNSENYQNIFKL